MSEKIQESNAQFSESQATPRPAGLANVPISDVTLTKKDFTPDGEVRWCPGCGDYSILATFQAMLPKLGIRRENVMVVSGIGCSSRFPYYMDTYGIHSIHGRAPAIATGYAIARPDLNVWVITGDGDSLSIGGNHLIHALRRNVNMTIVLFNNRIYGLTKGQYSPTSETGKVTKSSPVGSLDQPFNPVSVALGAEASFVARVVDTDRELLTEVFEKAAAHRGASLIEVYQNCPIFNPGAFDALKQKSANDSLIKLVDGQPITFGENNEFGVTRNPDGSMRICEISEVGLENIVVHDLSLNDPSQAYALARLTDTGIIQRSPVGIFYQTDRPAYADSVQQDFEVAAGGGNPDLQVLFDGDDSWEII